jgi:hypothetical protein
MKYQLDTSNIKVIFNKYILIKSCIYIILIYKNIINLYIKWDLYVFFQNILSYNFSKLLIYYIDSKLRPTKNII